MSPQAQVSPERVWRVATRVSFRFVFLYFSLFCLSTQIIMGFLPLVIEAIDPSSLPPIRATVFWTAAHVFGLHTPLVYQGSGSGDKTFDWVLAFCILIIAGAGTVLWTSLDRQRADYSTLHKWFCFFLRFALGGQLLAYGMVKFIPLQMPYPSLAKLVEPFGSFSPMGVLWSSIGAAPAYETFVGSAEMLAALLLFFPRTAFLGALVALADLTEVFLLNMTYDVPVKLFSFHLLVMSVVLLAPELPRLARFFFTDWPLEARPSHSLFRGSVAVQAVLAVCLVGMNAYAARTAWRMYGGGAKKSPLYGIWNDDKPDVYRRVIFDFPGYLSLQDRSDRIVNYPAKVDLKQGAIAIDTNAAKGNLKFSSTDRDRMMLDGNVGAVEVHMRLTRVDPASLPLASRGFHWIQEYPFNR